jgi:hypothetical protein
MQGTGYRSELGSVANAWRWTYARPLDVTSLGALGAGVARQVGGARRGREWQDEQVRTTGFVAHADVGHAVTHALTSQGYHLTVAAVAGQLAAVATPYNWQGNARIAQLIHRSERTVQRARAVLEAEKLITSHLLLTGDMVEGQRAPVRHPQVIRDVSRLQRLAGARGTAMRQPQGRSSRPAKRRQQRTAVEVPQERATAADLADVLAHTREAAPEFAQYISVIAAAEASRQRPPAQPAQAPRNCRPAEIDPPDIDAWDATTEELEHRRERSPPERGPPAN